MNLRHKTLQKPLAHAPENATRRHAFVFASELAPRFGMGLGLVAGLACFAAYREMGFACHLRQNV